MRRALLVGTLLAPVLIVLIGACSSKAPESTPASTPASAANVPPLEEYRNGLSDTERQEFYHLSEGGEILPLALLRALDACNEPRRNRRATVWCLLPRTSSVTASSPTQ